MLIQACGILVLLAALYILAYGWWFASKQDDIEEKASWAAGATLTTIILIFFSMVFMSNPTGCKSLQNGPADSTPTTPK